MTVRAGVVTTRRTVIYSCIGVAVTVAICVATVVLFGMPRVFTGLLVGVVAAVAVLLALFKRDVVVLTDAAIYWRTPLAETVVDWDRVVAGRFTLDEQARWTLALDLTEGDEHHAELVLLSIPPVEGPVSGAYDLRKREQVNEVRKMLRQKKVPVTVLPEIAGALEQHWRIAPATG